jgi:hypothetical protein
MNKRFAHAFSIEWLSCYGQELDIDAMTRKYNASQKSRFRRQLLERRSP